MIYMAIEDILMGDETLFQNINAFNPDYMPENFNFRDSQMEGMAMCIRPAIQGGRPTNSVIMGSCATGKTTALKKVFELVEHTTDKVVCCYINCQLHTTRFGIFSQIHKKLFGHQPPETGVPFSRVYEKVMNKLSADNKALVVAFDDVNYLFQTQHANKIFYDILRAYEEFEGVRTGIFAIISDLEFRYALDKNVNTVFIPQDITFQPYTYSEIFSILQDRARAGFYHGVISDEIIEEIANHTLEVGDLRVGIDLLRVCGNIAEANASRSITLEHVEEAVSKQGSINLMETINSLNDIERTLLRAVVDSDEILTAGDLSKQFKEEAGVSYATFNRTLEKLEFLRLVDTKFTGKGVRGNSREIILRFSPEDIKRCNL
ncbi:MAG: ORC1-type DNA replication protein [Methanobrevibacter sp.]|nr:ORC1-type DNA replication protein [Methanobrevibacter sp.]MBO7211431.1 ORC1-type DNA replication protein [Methanobrevibacter sp.]MBO7731163.1 ORC1-type DNA replication protein [Methanobrevibacter sp.]MBP5784768.1 ORC1-type DNA replication protein [Methanobrevibacter sp.]